MKSYIKYFRRQPKHIQHIHAIIFASSITIVIAYFVLYNDYGFWHERYSVDEQNVASNIEEVKETESPFQMVSSFLDEAKKQLGNIGKEGATSTGEN